MALHFIFQVNRTRIREVVVLIVPFLRVSVSMSMFQKRIRFPNKTESVTFLNFNVDIGVDADGDVCGAFKPWMEEVTIAKTRIPVNERKYHRLVRRWKQVDCR